MSWGRNIVSQLIFTSLLNEFKFTYVQFKLVLFLCFYVRYNMVLPPPNVSIKNLLDTLNVAKLYP